MRIISLILVKNILQVLADGWVIIGVAFVCGGDLVKSAFMILTGSMFF